MCGICGYVGDSLIDNDTLVAMNDTMFHRGPNDSGIWTASNDSYSVGLAQRRLSILDTSILGHQPMLSHDERFVISYNGEIYNYREIKVELEILGFSFVSNCDTEVILAAFEQWGNKCFERFNGMFAIAIYDSQEGRLTLARDRMGKKPLYYYVKGNKLVFASELKPIVMFPSFEKEIDYDSVGLYLCNKYIRAPKTIFKNVYKLMPGAILEYDCEKQLYSVNKYWDLLTYYNENEEVIYDCNEAKKQLDELLHDSMSKRLISDVPLGCFLSGGIDSTLTTAIAQSEKKQPIDTFTIGFYDKERNEAPEAKKIAEFIGTKHHEIYMSEEEILEQIKNISVYYDEPFSDPSQLPCMLVSQIASREVTVALSGDGGDELFCGYKMYDLNKIDQKLDFLGKMEYQMPWNNVLLKRSPAAIRAFVNNRSDMYKVQLFTDVFMEEVENILIRPLINAKNDVEGEIVSDNLQKKRMILDMLDYLPNDILAKMDRASMKYSLEVRCPILDHRIVEWASKVDHSLKYHGKEKKYLLKQLTYDYVPKELLEGPKRGFGVPLKKWLRTVLKDDIYRVSDKTVLQKQGIFDFDGIRHLIYKQKMSNNVAYSHILWGFYVFQLWYNDYIEEIA